MPHEIDMEPIHRIDHGPVPVQVSRVVRRKRSGEPGDFERELEEDHAQHEPAESQPQHEDTPVSPPEEDEVGSHLDLTA
jgi:hypothetical protein